MVLEIWVEEQLRHFDQIKSVMMGHCLDNVDVFTEILDGLWFL